MTVHPVVLVTGAARRIGAEIARVLHQNGMNIAIHYHQSQQEAEALCDDLNLQRKNSAAIFQADLKDVGSLSNLVNDVYTQWKRIDALINNASIYQKNFLNEITAQDWDDIMAANVKSAFFLAQAAATHLKNQKGVIINIGDAKLIHKHYPIYCISKAALIGMTKVLATELAPDIRVNTISPGQIIWPEGANALTEQMKAMRIEKIALQKQGKPEDIANAVLFLLQKGSYITGENICVDGG